MNRRMIAVLCLVVTSSNLFASEVTKEKTRVIIREHPKTGKSYVSIISTETSEPPDPFTGQRGRVIRPDYRLLDSKIKSGAIPYEGPVSDKTKIYIFAASLMTLGAVSGALVLAAAPAATGAAASGGAGAYLAGGTAVVAGSAAAVGIATAPDKNKEDYEHKSQYRLEESKESE